MFIIAVMSKQFIYAVFLLIGVLFSVNVHADSKRVAVSEKYESAVVKIETLKNGSVVSLGAGFFISADGKILTNRHVMDKKKSVSHAVRVKLQDGKIFNDYEILKCGDDRNIDLCLIKINHNPKSYFKVVDFKPKKGSDILVLGHPRGYEYTLSTGVVSGFYSQVSSRGRRATIDYVQITAPISPGNSGGPVFDENGNLIGVSTWVRSDRGSQNLNFAVAANEIADFVLNDSLVPVYRATETDPTSEPSSSVLSAKPTARNLDVLIPQLVKLIESDKSIGKTGKDYFETSTSIGDYKFVMSVPSLFEDGVDCKWSGYGNEKVYICKSKSKDVIFSVTLSKGKPNVIDNAAEVYKFEAKYPHSVVSKLDCRKKDFSAAYFLYNSTACLRHIMNDGASGILSINYFAQRKDDPYMVFAKTTIADSSKNSAYLMAPFVAVSSIKRIP